MNVGIVGCNGRVGQLLTAELQSDLWMDKGLVLAGGTSRKPVENAPFFITADAEKLFERSDVIIDFTLPEGMRQHIALARKHKTTLIIGTSGITKDDERLMQEAANDIVVVYSANMSVGVNVLFSLVAQAAATLNSEWDIEIFESHHKHKIDAPSGAALALGKMAAQGRGVDFDDVADFNRHGVTGVREEGTIGFSVARGGDVVGEHTAFFFNEGERLELTHRSTNRNLFAKGALHAALWSKGKAAGLYSMKDVLNLK